MPPGIALFDVLGTVLDERRGFRAAVASVDAPAGSPVADGVASGELSWRPWDQVIGDALTDLDPGADDRGYGAELRSVGHRLPPWPDSRVGVEAISGACRVVALSKGGIGPFVDCSRAGGLVWDAVLSSEMVRSAEPDLQVYRFAPDVLGVDPADVVMVAAHPSDLRADDAFDWTAPGPRRPRQGSHALAGPVSLRRRDRRRRPDVRSPAAAERVGRTRGGARPRRGPHPERHTACPGADPSDGATV